MTLAVSLLLIGLDFYVFNTREILEVSKLKYTVYIKDQIVFQIIAYLLLLPLFLVVFVSDILPWKYLGWFYGLLIMEHFSQESIRLHIVLSRPTMSSIILFLRSGAWVYAIISLFYFDSSARNLPVIWSGWMVGVSASILLSFYSLRKLPWRNAWRIPVNWVWIKKGLKTSLPFLCSTLSLTGIQYLDRYFLQQYYGEAFVGIYTLYFSISNVIHIVIYTGLVMILHPKLIYAFQHKEYDKYRAIMKKFTLGIFGGLSILVFFALILIKPVLGIIGKQIYAENINIFYLMLVNVSFMVLAYIPHYGLFVRKHDKSIIFSNILAFVVAFCANLILVPAYGLTGAAVATMIAMVTMAVMKGLLVLTLKKSKCE